MSITGIAGEPIRRMYLQIISLNKKHGITPKYIAQTEKIQTDKKTNLLGLQSQLWTETVRSVSIFDELLLPNLPVFSERAWSIRPHWMIPKQFRGANDGDEFGLEFICQYVGTTIPSHAQFNLW